MKKKLLALLLVTAMVTPATQAKQDLFGERLNFSAEKSSTFTAVKTWTYAIVGGAIVLNGIAITAEAMMGEEEKSAVIKSLASAWFTPWKEESRNVISEQWQKDNKRLVVQTGAAVLGLEIVAVFALVELILSFTLKSKKTGDDAEVEKVRLAAIKEAGYADAEAYEKALNDAKTDAEKKVIEQKLEDAKTKVIAKVVEDKFKKGIEDAEKIENEEDKKKKLKELNEKRVAENKRLNEKFAKKDVKTPKTPKAPGKVVTKSLGKGSYIPKEIDVKYSVKLDDLPKGFSVSDAKKKKEFQAKRVARSKDLRDSLGTKEESKKRFNERAKTFAALFKGKTGK
jgi:hypothetical protein